MKHYIVKDTMEAFVKVLDGKTGAGKEYFYGLTTEASIARNMSQENIKAGIGGQIVGAMFDEDGFDISITTGVYYEDTIELQMGEELKDVTSVTIKEITEDEDGTVVAKDVKVAGNALDLAAGSIPKNVSLQLRTVAYDGDTNEIVAHIFYIFDKASPGGEFSHSYGMSTNNIQEVTFKALVPKGSKSYGKYVIVPVKTGDKPYTPVV